MPNQNSAWKQLENIYVSIDFFYLRSSIVTSVFHCRLPVVCLMQYLSFCIDVCMCVSPRLSSDV